MRALEATDPAGLPEDVRDYALSIAVPALHLYYQIALRSLPELERAAADALAKHEQYWSHAERANMATGFVSWPISAALAIAAEHGMDARVDSPYLIRV
jgi:hypothetical protein